MKTKAKTIGEYCPLCAVLIPEYHTDRVVRMGIAYHHKCLKDAFKQKVEKQQVLDFGDMESIHVN